MCLKYLYDIICGDCDEKGKDDDEENNYSIGRNNKCEHDCVENYKSNQLETNFSQSFFLPACLDDIHVERERVESSFVLSIRYLKSTNQERKGIFKTFVSEGDFNFLSCRIRIFVVVVVVNDIT